MTLQWTVVAVWLYVEIFVVALLLLPWIRPYMWNKLFKSRLVRAVEQYANVYSWAGVGILLLLFFDSCRDIRRYVAMDHLRDQETFKTANVDPVVHAKRFFHERNALIAGAALLGLFIVRRLVMLISREAQLQASSEAVLKQAQGASSAAKSMLDDESKGNSKQVTALKETIENLEEELESARKDRDAMKAQAVNLQTEYDRVAEQLSKLEGGSDKKDD